MDIVLIVEDDPINQMLLKEYLNYLDFIPLLAKTGMEAVDYVKNRPEIKIVLMDLRLPEIDGFYATKLIKSIRPDLPVIAQTAYTYGLSQEQIGNDGFSAYLSKPYSADELKSILDQVLYGNG